MAKKNELELKCKGAWANAKRKIKRTKWNKGDGFDLNRLDPKINKRKKKGK